MWIYDSSKFTARFHETCSWTELSKLRSARSFTGAPFWWPAACCNNIADENYGDGSSQVIDVTKMYLPSLSTGTFSYSITYVNFELSPKFYPLQLRVVSWGKMLPVSFIVTTSVLWGVLCMIARILIYVINWFVFS